jgi:hypothetical protein
VNVSCSFCCSTRTTSPGCRPGSVQPASPRSTILLFCFMPGSMPTSKVFFSETRQLPLQLVQRSPAERRDGAQAEQDKCGSDTWQATHVGIAEADLKGLLLIDQAAAAAAGAAVACRAGRWRTRKAGRSR